MNVSGVANLGSIVADSRVHIEITDFANVRLLEPECVVLRQFGYPYVYRGGLFSPGEVVLRVPDDGEWWLVVDREGLAPGTTLASAATIVRRPRRPSLIRRLWSRV